MSPRQKRMALVFGIVAGVSVAGALALSAFRQNVTFFFDPSQVAAGQVASGERFRLGGMVTKGSVQRAPGSLEVHFVVTDFKHDVPVSYTGVLPDLFREGQGIVAHGRMTGNTFVADEVLAKHDEKYMPPEVARSLKKAEGAPGAPAGAASAAPTDNGTPQTRAPAPPAEQSAPQANALPSAAKMSARQARASTRPAEIAAPGLRTAAREPNEPRPSAPVGAGAPSSSGGV